MLVLLAYISFLVLLDISLLPPLNINHLLPGVSPKVQSSLYFFSPYLCLFLSQIIHKPGFTVTPSVRNIISRSTRPPTALPSTPLPERFHDESSRGKTGILLVDPEALQNFRFI